jgi:hypothetical protein
MDVRFGEFWRRAPYRDKSIKTPGWLYDYPKGFYSGMESAIREARNIFDQIALDATCDIDKVPAWLSVLSADSKNCNQEFRECVREKICNDLRSIRTSLGFSLCAIYCYVMGFMLECAIKSLDVKSACRTLREILFPNGKENMPLFLYDPKTFVASVMNLLEIALVACAEENILFHGFEMTHPKVLKGRLTSGEWMTVMAYCGQCGSEPLIYGVNNVCTHAKKLICSCGFCCQECNSQGISF